MRFISTIAAVLLALPFMAAAQCQLACCDVLVRALDNSGAGSKLVINISTFSVLIVGDPAQSTAPRVALTVVLEAK